MPTCLLPSPLDCGGLAQPTAVATSPYAFLASVRATQHDRILGTRDCQIALLRFTEPAYEMLSTAICSPLTDHPQIIKVLPPTASALARPTANSSPNTQPTKKIQSVIGKVVSHFGRLLLRNLVLPPIGSEDASAKATGTHFLLATSRSQQSRMIAASLWFDSNVIEKDSFVHFTRYYLGLDQLLKPWCPSAPPPMLNGPRQSICMAGHEFPTPLRPDCSHLNACPGSYGARHAAHERLNRVYAAFIREAGHEAIVNPSTSTMMEGSLGDAHARLLFPKAPTAAAKDKAEKLACALLASAIVGGSEAAKRQADATIRKLTSECSDSHKGLRVDCIAELPRTQLWIDVGVVHPTAASKLTQTLNFTRKQFIAERAARGSRVNNALTGIPSPPVLTYQTVKERKYAAMALTASKDARAGKRARAPKMMPCILSHIGELSPTALSTIELITRAFHTTASKKHYEDGIPLKRRTAQFRTRFKDAIMCANASGFGRTISLAGQPRAGCSVSSPDVSAGMPDWEVVY